MSTSTRPLSDMHEQGRSSDRGGLGRVVKHTGWNVLGQLLPVLAALVAIPILVRLLGLERFGFLTLAWVLIGYASVFDFGLGRALTRCLSLRLVTGDHAGAREAFSTALAYLALFGILLALLVGAVSPWLVGGVFKLSPGVIPEAQIALIILAASIPVVMLTAGYVAALTAHHHFKSINLVRMGFGVFSFIAPVGVAFHYQRLDAVIGAIVIVRLASNAIYSSLCSRQCGYRLVLKRPDLELSRELFGVGGWISVSNIVSPLLSYLDRLLLAAIVPVKVVALYATPYDLLSRTMIVPHALTATLFPSAAAVPTNSDQAWKILTTSTRAIFLVTFPLTLVLFAFAEHGLRFWLGSDFAQGSTDILRILAFGVLFNSLAQCPAMMIQANGHPRSMALLHLIELPIFVALFWLMSSEYGVIGAAMAATARLTLDAIAMFVLAISGMGRVPNGLHKATGWAVIGCALLAGTLLGESVASSMAYTSTGLVAFFLLAWRYLITAAERKRIHAIWRRQT